MSKLIRKERDPDRKFMSEKDSKYGKNLQKVKDMVDGTYGRKIMVGHYSVGGGEVERKVGDRWIDSDDKEWEKTSWGKKSVSKAPDRGIADKCNTCEAFIFKEWDKDTYKADGRCYHCQLNYELDLQFDKPIRWFAYRRLKDFKNMKAIERDMDQWFEEKEKRLQENPFDKSVANAMANSNVEMTINKNKM